MDVVDAFGGFAAFGGEEGVVAAVVVVSCQFSLMDTYTC